MADPRSLEEELQLVSEEDRKQFENHGSDHETIKAMTARSVACGGLIRDVVMVYVTFKTQFLKKIERMELGGRTALSELARRASQVFSESEWKLYCGKEGFASGVF